MELVKVLDKKNEYTGNIKGRKELVENEYRNLVHIWVINSKGELLIQKRSALKKHYPNLWSVTSGCVHYDETFVDTCKRELKEEINVDLNEDNLEYVMSYKLKEVVVQVYTLYQDVDVSKIKLQEEEVSDYKFVTKEELLEMIEKEETAGSINYFEFFYKVLKYELE